MNIHDQIAERIASLSPEDGAQFATWCRESTMLEAARQADALGVAYRELAEAEAAERESADCSGYEHHMARQRTDRARTAVRCTRTNVDGALAAIDAMRETNEIARIAYLTHCAHGWRSDSLNNLRLWRVID